MILVWFFLDSGVFVVCLFAFSRSIFPFLRSFPFSQYSLTLFFLFSLPFSSIHPLHYRKSSEPENSSPSLLSQVAYSVR